MKVAHLCYNIVYLFNELPDCYREGFYYITTKKGMKRASADVGFMFIAYNLRRLINIVDKKVLKKFLQEPGLLFFEIATLPNFIKRILTHPIFSKPQYIYFQSWFARNYLICDRATHARTRDSQNIRRTSFQFDAPPFQGISAHGCHWIWDIPSRRVLFHR